LNFGISLDVLACNALAKDWSFKWNLWSIFQLRQTEFFVTSTIIGFGFRCNMLDSFHSDQFAGISSLLTDFNFQYLTLFDFMSSLLRINRFY